MTDVCVFGLGLMGVPAAHTLSRAGLNVIGWNRSTLPADRAAGIRLAEDIRPAARADVCLLFLAGSEAVADVLIQIRPYLSKGQIVLDMGTSDPVQSKAHAVYLSARGVGWVDAPVSGGPEGAASGSLAIMAGGSEADVGRVRPVLDALGENVVHVGEAGMGHVVKVINQLIVGLTIQAVAEGLTLAERSGVEPTLVQAALRGGFADSKILQLHGERMIRRSYLPGGKVKTQLRDLQLAQGMAAELELGLPHLDSTAAIYKTLLVRGDGDLDHSAPHKLLWDD
jgi:3-hydroxyisobutyrate dehydrogenase-like beta-hydroxyacid dehydrogenase